jgi:crossover junction endodeoxyribonuclease RusA
MADYWFRVHGIPVPQGSKRAFKVGNRINLVEANKNLPAWREKIAASARLTIGANQPLLGPVSVELCFWMPKPKKPTWWAPAVKPDLDKLTRAVFDAITSIIIKDDSQIIELKARKLYTNNANCGVMIYVTHSTQPKDPK